VHRDLGVQEFESHLRDFCALCGDIFLGLPHHPALGAKASETRPPQRIAPCATVPSSLPTESLNLTPMAGEPSISGRVVLILHGATNMAGKWMYKFVLFSPANARIFQLPGLRHPQCGADLGLTISPSRLRKIRNSPAYRLTVIMTSPSIVIQCQ